MMEEDAENILSFMAANGLVANPSKTAFLLLNVKKRNREELDSPDIKVTIGNVEIKRQSCAKLLGMNFEDTQKWNEHIHGKGGVIASLNQRLYLIRRLKNQKVYFRLREINIHSFIHSY